MLEGGQVNRIEQRRAKSESGTDRIQFFSRSADHYRYSDEREHERSDTNRSQPFCSSDRRNERDPRWIGIEQEGQGAYRDVLEAVETQICNERLSESTDQQELNDFSCWDRGVRQREGYCTTKENRAEYVTPRHGGQERHSCSSRQHGQNGDGAKTHCRNYDQDRCPTNWCV